MPRFPRNYIKTSFFHIMTQGINKSYIFSKEDDIKYYISSMYKLKEEHEVKIISYCIMNNHAHILIETNTLKELSKYMQRLNTKYAKYYNKKYNRVGYVFRDRYKSEGIYSDEHLYNCIKYIYDNPVKAGICKKPEDYAYSNYKKIDIELNENYRFIDVDEENKITIDKYIKGFLNNDINPNDTKMLREIIITLKENYNFSLRKIAEELNINREKIRRIYNK